MNRSYAPIPLLGIIGAVQVVLAIYCIRTGAIPHGRRPQTIRANNPRILAHHRGCDKMNSGRTPACGPGTGKKYEKENSLAPVIRIGSMPAVYEITFLPGGRVEEFAGTCGNYYEFADGSHLDVLTEPVWCPRCGKVTHGESIPSVEQLDKKLADYHDPTSILYRSTMRALLPRIEGPDDRENFRQERIKEIGRRREWRLTRHSPAKCIHCVCAEIVALPHDKPVTIVRNSKPLTLISRCVGLCSMNPNDWYFTPEGERILRPS